MSGLLTVSDQENTMPDLKGSEKRYIPKKVYFTYTVYMTSAGQNYWHPW